MALRHLDQEENRIISALLGYTAAAGGGEGDTLQRGEYRRPLFDGFDVGVKAIHPNQSDSTLGLRLRKNVSVGLSR